MSTGMPYTATVTVSYAGTNGLKYSFMSNGGYYTQIGSTNQFTFTPNVSGGPFTDYVIVDDGCQLAWGSLAGIRTPPADVSGATATPGEQSITLNWTNPSSANFDHVQVSGSGFTTVNVATPGTATTLSGFTDGQSYTITLQAVDAYGNVSAGVSLSAMPGLRIFVTNAVYTGNLGGPGGANADCATAASAAGLRGTFVALLSTSTLNANTLVAANATYFNTINQVIGSTATLLGGGSITNPPDYNEYGQEMVNISAWTGSNADGITSGSTCSDWTYGSGNFYIGEFGVPYYVTSGWLSFATNVCSDTNHLYCIQQ